MGLCERTSSPACHDCAQTHPHQSVCCARVLSTLQHSCRTTPHHPNVSPPPHHVLNVPCRYSSAACSPQHSRSTRVLRVHDVCERYAFFLRLALQLPTLPRLRVVRAATLLGPTALYSSVALHHLHSSLTTALRHRLFQQQQTQTQTHTQAQTQTQTQAQTQTHTLHTR
jgi:hypothetical protein